MTDRLTIDVADPVGGWGQPWPNVAEIADVLPYTSWTLVGGLMAQLYAAHRGIDGVRATRDVDMVLHIETTRGVVADAARSLEELGYEFVPPFDPRNKSAHRFTRERSGPGEVSNPVDVVDVLIADHAAPSVVEPLRGRRVVAVPGGTQALRRTLNARLAIREGSATTVSVPSPFGAVILKAAAFVADSRDSFRHLQDAALLLAAIDDPLAIRDQLAGSDRTRLNALAQGLADGHAWRDLSEPWRTEGQTALRILTSGGVAPSPHT